MEKDAAKLAGEKSGSPDADPTPESSPLLSREEVRRKVSEVRDQARDATARTHQTLDDIRKLMHGIGELTQHLAALREREDEERALGTPRSSPLFPPFENAPSSPSPFEILLIDDNPGDIRLFQEALRECETACRVSHVTKGSELLALVRKEGAFADLPRPQLIILDLILLDISAEEVIAALRAVPAYQAVPVVVFSGVEDEAGQRRSTQIGASTFIQKPANLPAFFAAVRRIVDQWLAKAGSRQRIL
jgi:CheY-like chemotaxis protein